MDSVSSERMDGRGAVFAQEERLLFFIIHCNYHFLFYANPLPSFIPHSLNPHNRQVDDHVAGEEEVLLKGVVVDSRLQRLGSLRITIGNNLVKIRS